MKNIYKYLILPCFPLCFASKYNVSDRSPLKTTRKILLGIGDYLAMPLAPHLVQPLFSYLRAESLR